LSLCDGIASYNDSFYQCTGHISTDVALRVGLRRRSVIFAIDVINVFYSGHPFTFFNVFPRFLFKKTLSKAKYEYVKIQLGASAKIFDWFWFVT